MMQSKVLVITQNLDIFTKLNDQPVGQFTLINIVDAASAVGLMTQSSFVGCIIDFDLLAFDKLLDLIDLVRPKIHGPICIIGQEYNDKRKTALFEHRVDDFLIWPVNTSELAARLNQRLWAYRQPVPKLSVASPEDSTQPRSSAIKLRDLTIDLAQYRVLRNGVDLGLTPKEFNLLHYLIKNNGQVLSRDQILNKIWGYGELESSRIVDIHISHLRDKIELDSKNPTIIKTARGFGYIFEEKDFKIDYKD